MLALAPFASAGAAGRFQYDLAGLVAAVVTGAFLLPTVRHALRRVPAAAVPAWLAHAALGGGAGGAFALAFLVVAVAVAAGGFARLGHTLGGASLPASLVAGLLLLVAMGGLFWADPAAEHVPRPRRHALRQAVLHVDPALAAAYDAAGFDRLRAPGIYDRVPLASSLVEPPRAGSTGALWLCAGLAFWGCGALLARRSGTA